MASLTHFAFYPKDWLGDVNVRMAGYEAQGVYMTLLALMWQAEDGTCSLPLDDAKVARGLLLDVRSWKRIKVKIWHLFDLDIAAGTFFHGRLRKEWQRAHSLRERAVKGEEGRKRKAEEARQREISRTSGELPANIPPNFPGTSGPISERNPAEKHETGSEQGSTTHTQTHTQKKLNSEEKHSPKRFAPKIYPPEFEAWWDAYPAKRGSKAEAAALHAGWIAGGESAERLLAAARNYAAECRRDQRETRFVKHASAFLAREKQPWLNYLEAKVEPIAQGPVIRDAGLAALMAKKAALRPAERPPPDSGVFVLIPEKSSYARRRR